MFGGEWALTVISEPLGWQDPRFRAHELSRGAITSRVLPHASDPKSTLSNPLGHPIPYRNAVQQFPYPRFDFTTVFNLIELFYLVLFENTQFTIFGLFNLYLADFVFSRD